MAGIFGSLTSDDTNKGFLATQGQIVVWDTVQEWLMRVNADFNSSLGIFVEESTEGFKERYPLPGSGYLQSRNNQGNYGSVKASGKINVAFPLNDKGAQVSWNDVTVAKMTARQLENHLDTIRIQNQNTVRFDMLFRIFDNTQDTYTDEDYGSLSIEPLANGDSVVYPAVVGSDTEATEDHYLESSYLGSAISDTNNPLITIRQDLEHHYEEVTGGQNIVVFCHSDNSTKLQDLSGFREVTDNFVLAGDDADQPINLPSVPGKVLGRSDGTWVVEWNRMPTGYLYGTNADIAAPLKMRVDEAITGLPRGLALVATDMNFPFTNSIWRHRYGFGCANRLNGVVMELGTGGTYTIPTAYQ